MSETVREACADQLELPSTGRNQDWQVACLMFRDEVHRLNNEIVAKDAEIARLNAAMKPVLECSSASCDVFQGRRCADAIREAKRIMNEFYNGESHN